MNVVYIVVSVALVGLLMVGIFALGMLFAANLLADAHDAAQYDRLREEYYMLAQFKNIKDPRPYVPPQSVVIPNRKLPRSKWLPGMSSLDRLMRNGKRGTIMWRAGDRRRNVDGST